MAVLHTGGSDERSDAMATPSVALPHPHCGLAVGYDLDWEVSVETEQSKEVVVVTFPDYNPCAARVSKVLGDRSQQFGEGGRHTRGIFFAGQNASSHHNAPCVEYQSDAVAAIRGGR
jgi:hypothetical protein